MGDIVTRQWVADQVHAALANPVQIGVDVGQLHDPTAICVSEVERKSTGKVRLLKEPIPGHLDHRGQWIPPHDADPVLRSEYTVRSIRRVPLGTSYPEIAKQLAELLCSPLLERRKVRLLIDVTGVGRPVYQDLLAEIALKPRARAAQIKPITFTSGDNYRPGTGVLGKAYLVSRLQTLLQSDRIHAPDTPEAKATLEELKVYEIHISQSGKDIYGAFETGKHDDLATALGLSALEDPFGDQVRYSNRVY